MRPAVTRDASGRGKRTKQKPHAVDVLRNFRMHVGVSSFEIRAGVQRRPAVAGTRNINNICVRFADQPVQMHVDKILPGRRAPVPQQARLNVLLY